MMSYFGSLHSSLSDLGQWLGTEEAKFSRLCQVSKESNLSICPGEFTKGEEKPGETKGRAGLLLWTMSMEVWRGSPGPGPGGKVCLERVR